MRNIYEKEGKDTYELEKEAPFGAVDPCNRQLDRLAPAALFGGTQSQRRI
jgi:hypothetical protein